MARRGPGRVAAGFLSMLAPGAGQVYAGAGRRGALLLAASAALLAMLLAVALTTPFGLGSSVGRDLLGAVLAGNVALLAFRLFAVVDAWRLGRSAVSALAVAGLALVAAATAAPHVGAAYVAVRGYEVLENVFAGEEPRDVLAARDGLFLAEQQTPVVWRKPVWPGGLDPAESLPAPVRVPRDPEPLSASRRVLAGGQPATDRPWVTILLVGSDAGPGRPGARTDTMILAALQRGTGRAVAFGIPRNLVEVPLGAAARRALPRFRQPLNALYAFAHTRPELFPGGDDPGATALKQTVSRLLGVRVDYFALVDLAGFADLVDALGGVEIRVKERIRDEVTRPKWGETKPTLDVHPGRTYHFFGRDALVYVRSRKTSNDYTRMARQRCFLSAMAQQLDVVRVLRHFDELAGTVEASVRTDIPLARLADLVRLAAAVRPRDTLTQTFGVEYFARRRASDRFPVPDAGAIRATVREAILSPRRALAEGRVASVRQAC